MDSHIGNPLYSWRNGIGIGLWNSGRINFRGIVVCVGHVDLKSLSSIPSYVWRILRKSILPEVGIGSELFLSLIHATSQHFQFAMLDSKSNSRQKDSKRQQAAAIMIKLWSRMDVPVPQLPSVTQLDGRGTRIYKLL